MTIPEFIEKAIEGGWDDTNFAFHSPTEGWECRGWRYDEKVFLDPEAWKAVGKVEGWGEVGVSGFYEHGTRKRWKYNIHRMIDAIADGKSIEQYLETL